MSEQIPLQCFWSKIEVTPSCWVWRGGKDGNGYGAFYFNCKMVYAHRLAYELLEGHIPNGLQIDHLCRNPPCVNPAHLEVVTQRENIRRGNTSLHNKIKTHCPQGHMYNEENTYIDSKNRRHCRTCNNEYERQYQTNYKVIT